MEEINNVSDADDDHDDQALPRALAGLRECARSVDAARRAALAELDQHRAAAKREAEGVRAEFARVRASLHEFEEEDDGVEEEERGDRGASKAESAAAPPSAARADRAMAELAAAVRRLGGPAAPDDDDGDDNEDE